jgi:hypothetical protein
MAKNESVFYRYLRDQFKSLSLIRIENSALQGTPDLLIQNKKGTFFTVELKVIKSNRKPKFSPHQISFHVQHSKNSFILIKQKSPVASAYKLYTGDQIKSLVSCGVKTPPVACDLSACALIFENL